MLQSIKNIVVTQVGADSIIQVGSDSLLLCSVIYKFVITSTFNCHGTIAYIKAALTEQIIIFRVKKNLKNSFLKINTLKIKKLKKSLSSLLNPCHELVAQTGAEQPIRNRPQFQSGCHLLILPLLHQLFQSLYGKDCSIFSSTFSQLLTE